MGGIWSSFCREGVREEEITQAKKDDQLQAGVEVSDNLNPRKEIPYIDEDVPEENESEPETKTDKKPLEKQDSESVPDYAPPAPPVEENEEEVQQKKAELEAQVEEQMITKQEVTEEKMVPVVAAPAEVSPTIEPDEEQKAPEPPPPLEETAVSLSSNISEPLEDEENTEEVPLIDFTQPDDQEYISEQPQESIQVKSAIEEGDKTVICETEEIKTEFHIEDQQQTEQTIESATAETVKQEEMPITDLPPESHDMEEKVAPAIEEQTLPQAEPVIETATEISQPSPVENETIPSSEQEVPLHLETEVVEEQKELEMIQTEMQETEQAPPLPAPLETMPVEEYAQVTDSVPEETISPVESLPEPQPVQPTEAEQITVDTQEQSQVVAETTAEPQIAEIQNEEQPALAEAEPVLSQIQSEEQLIQGEAEHPEIFMEPEPEIIVEEGTTLPEEIPVDEYMGDLPSPVLEEPTLATEVPQEEIPQQNVPETPATEQAMPQDEVQQQHVALEKEEHSEVSISSEGDREVEELEKSAPLPEHMEGVTEEELEEEERRLIQQLMEHAEHDPDSQKLLDELLTHHQHPLPPPVHHEKEPLGTDEVSLNEAATRIQANYKGYILRKHLLKQKKQMEEQQRLAQEQQVLEPEQ